ncbi:right-handed parallel beta-helix repeat-containing protein [Phormidesmis sp. 146-35]
MSPFTRHITLISWGLIALAPAAAAQTPTQSVSPHKAFERAFYVNEVWKHPAFETVKPSKPAPESVEAIKPKTTDVSKVAQTATPPVAPPTATLPPPPVPTFSPRIGVRYNSQGAGINQVVGVEGFIPLSQTPAQRITFLEGRALYDTENRAFGGNFLVGYRALNPQNQRILGGYLAYDNRDTGNSFFHQLGAGVETLGEDWDARANVYVPIGTTRNQLGEAYRGATFQQNSLVLDRFRQYEAGLAGVDVEYGRKLTNLGQSGSLRGYAGLYYYAGNEGDDALGGRVRLAAKINEFAAIGFTVQHDSLFDTRAFVNVELSFPGNAARGEDRNPTIVSRLGSSVERTMSVTVDEQQDRDRVIALAPGTNQPLQVVHVELGTAGGNGTVESPFGTVNQALNSASNGVVYVRSGTNPGVAGFTVPAGVSVLSNAVPQTVRTAQSDRVLLPQSGSGVLPNVTSTITLGSDSALSGFRITPDTGSAIAANNVSGNVSITDNVIPTMNGVAPGISVENDSVPVNLTIARNTITDTRAEGIFVRSRGTAQTTATVTDNSTADTIASGIKIFTLDDAQLNANVANNTVTTNQSTIGQDGAIRIGTFNNGRVEVTVANNMIRDNESNGLFIGSEDTSIVRANILNNTATNNLGIGLFFGARQSSKEIGFISGNTVSRNRLNPNIDPPGFPSGHGIFVGAQERAENITTISNNTAINNEQNGIFAFVANQGKGTFNILNNTANNNRRNGIEVNVGLNPPPPPPNPIILPPPPVGTVQGVAIVNNNTAIGNVGEGPPGQEGGGIIVVAFNNAALQISMQGNQLRGNATFTNGFAGIGMVSLDNARLFANVRFNTFAQNAAPGFNAQSTGSSGVCLKLNNNTSDSPLIVGRGTGTTFQADTLGNAGPPVIQSGLPISAIGDCVVP